jgi:protein tyrosine phosphatase
VLLEKKTTEENTYINAVYTNGMKNHCNYIVTQLPMQSTLEDFWLMVWQKQACAVVLLNQPDPVNDPVRKHYRLNFQYPLL